MRRRNGGSVRAAGLAVLVGALTIGLTAGSAAAAVPVSQATARAIGGNIVNTGLCSATNNGSAAAPGTLTGPCTNSGAAVSSVGILSVAGLVAASTALNTGASAACAGVTGAGGGAIQVGPNAPCTPGNTTVNPGAASGVNLLNIVQANAVYATCQDVNGVQAGASTLVAASLGGSLASIVGVTGLGPLPTNPLINTTSQINLVVGPLTTPLLTLTLNKQTKNAAGELTVQALDLVVLPGLTVLFPAFTSGLHITIGTVTCGPNAKVAGVSTIPAKGLPIAGGLLIVLGGAAWFGRRRLFAAFQH